MVVWKKSHFHGYNDYENYETILDEHASKYVNEKYAYEAIALSSLPVNCNIPSDNKAYWIKSKYANSYSVNIYYNLCKVSNDGTFGEGGVAGRDTAYNACIYVSDGREYPNTNGLRVIVTLNSNVKTKGKIGDIWYLEE